MQRQGAMENIRCMTSLWKDLLDFELVRNDYIDEIKGFIVKICENDIKYITEHSEQITDTIKQHDCFLIACYYSNQITIELIIKLFNIDTDYVNDNYYTGLICASKNQQLEVIEFLVENLGISVSSTSIRGFNCLHLACIYNKNVNVIKYLTNHKQINIHWSNKIGETYLSYSADNERVFVYLIENTKIKISIDFVDFSEYKKFIPLITKYKILNKLIEMGIKKYNKSVMISLIGTIDPLLLSVDYYYIQYPFDKNFNDIYQRIKKLNVPLPDPEKEITFKYDNNGSDDPIHNFANNNVKILFKNNGIDYYGHRTIVYNKILVFNEIKDCAGFDDPVTLEPPIPQYLMNMYIQSTYTDKFNTKCIDPSDFKQFVKFIDKYPTTLLSINNMESIWIDHINNYNVDYDYFESICIRYHLKRMYIHLHNSKFKHEKRK